MSSAIQEIWLDGIVNGLDSDAEPTLYGVGRFHGTSMIAGPGIVPIPYPHPINWDKIWERIDRADRRAAECECSQDTSIPCIVVSTYGGGMWWPGRMCPTHNVLVYAADPWLDRHIDEGFSDQKGGRYRDWKQTVARWARDGWPRDGYPAYSDPRLAHLRV